MIMLLLLMMFSRDYPFCFVFVVISDPVIRGSIALSPLFCLLLLLPFVAGGSRTRLIT